MKKDDLKCFISYSHKDSKMCKEFRKHIDNLSRTYNISCWYDGEIPVGGSIDKEIYTNLNESDIIFLLISPDFISSYYCYEIELQTAIQRHNENKCIVIPVILHGFVSGNYPFNDLKFVPTDGKPIDKFNPRNYGFVDAATGIANLLQLFFNNKSVELENNVSTHNRINNSKSKNSKTKNDSNVKYQIVRNGCFSRFTLTQSFFDDITSSYITKLHHFFGEVANLNNNQIESFSKTLSPTTPEQKVLVKGKVDIENYFMQLFSYIQIEFLDREHTFVNFRVEDTKGYYNTFLQVGYPTVGLTFDPILSDDSLIGQSKRLGVPIIKSKNQSLHKKAHPNETVKRDYITFTFNEISQRYNVNISMCISCVGNNQKDFTDTFVMMSITRFDQLIEKFIIRYVESCRHLSPKYNLKKILEI